MKVLGVSGSPIKNSNTDRALQEALAATGVETEFVKLSDYTVAPCRACLCCAKNNRCVIDDDGVLLTEKAKEADALIIAGFTSYCTLDARTKTFIERLFPLRHQKGYMRGKPGGAIIASAMPEGQEMVPPAFEYGVNAVKFYMMHEGMNYQGEVKILGNVPCIACGFGNECDLSGIKMMGGPEATVETVGANVYEQQDQARQAATNLGRAIGDALRG